MTATPPTAVDPLHADGFLSTYGFGSHGAEIQLAETASTWWDERRIKETLSAQYIHQALQHSPLKIRLDQPLKFGEGLTESTYLEWIIKHAAKFFLILVELGYPDLIFSIIDDGLWDDEDLPLSSQTVGRLGLPGITMEKKFMKKQHSYLVRKLREGEHTEYADEEVIPLEVVSRRAPGGSGKLSVEKISFPRKPEVYYSRRRVLLSEDGPNAIPPDSLLTEIERIKAVAHPHIVSVHTSYTHQGYGYLVLAPCVDLNLKVFLQHPSPAWKSTPKDQRRRTIFNWLHCLSNALAFLHEKGLYHGDIKPSSIIIDQMTNNAFFADIGKSKRLELGMQPHSSTFLVKQYFAGADAEVYEYGAPELWNRTLAPRSAPTSPTDSIFSGRTYREMSRRSNTSSGSFYESRQSSATASNLSVGQWPSVIAPHHDRRLKSDVFALGCVFLETLSTLSKRKPSSFATYRGSKNRRSRESAPRDSSFHANLAQVNSWIDLLLKDHRKKPDAAFTQALAVIRTMLQRDPDARPQSRKVAEIMHSAVTSPAVRPMQPHCGLDTPMYGWPGSPLVPQASHASGRSGWRKSHASTSSEGSARWMAI